MTALQVVALVILTAALVRVVALTAAPLLAVGEQARRRAGGELPRIAVVTATGAAGIATLRLVAASGDALLPALATSIAGLVLLLSRRTRDER